MTLENKNLQKVETESPTERTNPRKVFQPAVDIYETKNGLALIADLPGVVEKDLDITLDKNILTLRASVNLPLPKEGFSPVYREFEIGDFERRFTVGNEIDQNGIEAKLENGVLRLSLPKAKDLQPRKINVRTN